MAIYGHIWSSTPNNMYFGCLDMYFGCLDIYFKCLDLYFGVWTCIWVPRLVFGCLDLYLGVLTCIWISGHIFWVLYTWGCLCTCRMWLWRVRSHPPWSMCLPRAHFCSSKSMPLEFGACILPLGKFELTASVSSPKQTYIFPVGARPHRPSHSKMNWRNCIRCNKNSTCIQNTTHQKHQESCMNKKTLVMPLEVS